MPPPTVTPGTPITPNTPQPPTPLAQPPANYAPPPFDWHALPDSDSSSWQRPAARCFAVGLSIPPGFATRQNFVGGYGLGETLIFASADPAAEIAIRVVHDNSDLARAQSEFVSHLQVYEIASGEIRSANGVAGYFRYSWDFMPIEGSDSGATYRVVYPLAPDLWVIVFGIMPQPYDEALAQDMITSIRSLTVGS